MTIEIPKPGKVERTPGNKKRIYIYGSPTTGKTYFATAFPKALILSTDGNYKFFDTPAIDIVARPKAKIGEKVIMQSAWEGFEEIVDSLAAGTEFQTIIIDLLEDVYEACRQFVLKREELDYEPNNDFGKTYKMIDDEFMRVMKKLNDLQYENIIYISHDKSALAPAIKKGGEDINTILPNIKEKVARKITGYTDFTGRIVANEGEYFLSIKQSPKIYGGGRGEFMNVDVELPATPKDCEGETPIYQNIKALYEGKLAKKEEKKEEPKQKVQLKIKKKEDE